MQKIITLALFFVAIQFATTNAAFAQTYAIGHMEKHYIDAARTNRDVWTEVYFPATAADTSVAAAGQFPTIVFGHGFLMAWSNYDYLWKFYVARGYVCVFPRTEGNAGPNHTNFGGDLRFLSNLFGNVLNTQTGKLQGHLTTKTAIAGHSMGAGSSYLGGSNNTQVTTMVTFAAAQTSPRSSTAAYAASCPNLVISGEKDCVAKSDTQLIIYNSLTAAPYKYYVSLKGGTHCNFASQGSVCELGQIGSCGTLARATQNARVLSLTAPWFNFHLKGDCAEFTRFKDTVNAMVAGGFATKLSTGEPLPTATIVQNGSLLTANTIGTNTYAWSNGATTASTTATTSGVYIVTVTRVSNGCTATASLSFTGTNEDKAFAEITLYPNPSTSTAQLNLRLTQASAIKIVLTDALGKVMLSQNNTDLNTVHQAELATENLAPGIYFITVETNQGKWTGKFTKQ